MNVTVALSAATRNRAASVSIAVFTFSVSGSVRQVNAASWLLIVVQIGASRGRLAGVTPSWLGWGLVNHQTDMYSV